ncbi:hypothetical protein HaLaN_02475 [Haematococcus lacustris]|uniref:Uncharacterized protein n=1 Tax=Haematococcus lacustris TaxID=44745 RepID=A0A699YLA9_HAELA|nr:hypothetical protein HaLaN_02475 [Haematococcus lacustris]
MGHRAGVQLTSFRVVRSRIWVEPGSEGEQLLRLTAVSQGLVPLKGVPEPVEVMQVKLVLKTSAL